MYDCNLHSVNGAYYVEIAGWASITLFLLFSLDNPTF